MPTNEERRKIAQKLRSLEYEALQHKGGFARAELHEIKQVTEFSESGAKTICGRLADLIEPEPEGDMKESVIGGETDGD